jgi:hypothetical protein
MALQPFVLPWPLFQFIDMCTVGRTPSTGDQPVARPLPTHRTTQTQNKRTQTSMPLVKFEPTIPPFELAQDSSCLRPRGLSDRPRGSSRGVYGRHISTATGFSPQKFLLSVANYHCQLSHLLSQSPPPSPATAVSADSDSPHPKNENGFKGVHCTRIVMYAFWAARGRTVNFLKTPSMKFYFGR